MEENLVAVENGAPVHRHLRGHGGFRANGNDDKGRFVFVSAVRIFHGDMRRVQKTGLPDQHVDVVAPELRFRYIDFGLDDVIHAKGRSAIENLFLDPIVDPVNFPIMKPRQVEDRLPHRLAGDGAGVDANAAEAFALLDDGDFLARFGGLNGGALARGYPSR